MPQLDTVTYLSQYTWLCFFFLSFYFALVRFFLPDMARILKFRHQKMAKIQGQSSLYMDERNIQQEKRSTAYTACLDLQKKLAETNGLRLKEVSEETWENQTITQNQNQNKLHNVLVNDYAVFARHMLSENFPIVNILLTTKSSPICKKGSFL